MGEVVCRREVGSSGGQNKSKTLTLVTALSKEPAFGSIQFVEPFMPQGILEPIEQSAYKPWLLTAGHGLERKLWRVLLRSLSSHVETGLSKASTPEYHHRRLHTYVGEMNTTKIIHPVTKQIKSYTEMSSSRSRQGEGNGGEVPTVPTIYYLKYPTSNKIL